MYIMYFGSFSDVVPPCVLNTPKCRILPLNTSEYYYSILTPACQHFLLSRNTCWPMCEIIVEQLGVFFECNAAEIYRNTQYQKQYLKHWIILGFSKLDDLVSIWTSSHEGMASKPFIRTSRYAQARSNNSSSKPWRALRIGRIWKAIIHEGSSSKSTLKTKNTINKHIKSS